MSLCWICFQLQVFFVYQMYRCPFLLLTGHTVFLCFTGRRNIFVTLVNYNGFSQLIVVLKYCHFWKLMSTLQVMTSVRFGLSFLAAYKISWEMSNNFGMIEIPSTVAMVWIPVLSTYWLLISNPTKNVWGTYLIMWVTNSTKIHCIY